ncbi:MAG: DUF5675 family protein [Janthinobacterium lividum]
MKLELLLKRQASFKREGKISGGTLGELSLNGHFFCYTLEDEVRPAGQVVAGETAIAAGTYPVSLAKSPRLGYLTPRLGGAVAGRGILLHRGNLPEDSLGCILVGLAKLPTGRKIYKSAEAFEQLMHRLLDASSITLTIC